MDLMMKKENNSPKLNPANNNGGWEVVPPQLKPYSPEWFLFNYLEHWNDDDVALAIREDIRPELGTFADLIIDQTTDFFVNFLRVNRPDVKSVQTREGREWIKRIVKSAMGIK